MTYKYLLTVITPVGPGRGKNLVQLQRDMYNQILPKHMWEHIIILDGWDEENHDTLTYLYESRSYNWRWYSIVHDNNEIPKAVGGMARNHATGNAQGEYVVYCDDDDRYRDDYLLTLVTGLGGNRLNCVQMTATDHQIRGNLIHNHITLIPEVGDPKSPQICHFGTPCMIYKKEWALVIQWRNEPNNDFIFCYNIVNRFHPHVTLHPGMRVDVKSQVIGNLKDWVTIPPFYRGI